MDLPKADPRTADVGNLSAWNSSARDRSGSADLLRARKMALFDSGSANLGSFDISRWDARDYCGTKFADLPSKYSVPRFRRVSLSSTSKGETKDRLCDKVTSATVETVFLTGVKDELKGIGAEANKRKSNEMSIGLNRP